MGGELGGSHGVWDTTNGDEEGTGVGEGHRKDVLYRAPGHSESHLGVKGVLIPGPQSTALGPDKPLCDKQFPGGRQVVGV